MAIIGYARGVDVTLYVGCVAVTGYARGVDVSGCVRGVAVGVVVVGSDEIT